MHSFETHGFGQVFHVYLWIMAPAGLEPAILGSEDQTPYPLGQRAD